jgi:uncharacterized protein (TIGR02246 family)
MTSPEIDDVRRLYDMLLEAWNKRDPVQYAGLFTTNGNVIGFDGTMVDGRHQIADHLAGIFASHETASYVAIIREIRALSPEIVILRAVAGMVPPNGSDINPAVNAVQTVVARHREGTWAIELFQNTPAAFHGRPDESEKLTEELRSAHRARG